MLEIHASDVMTSDRSDSSYPTLASSIHQIVDLLETYLNLGELQSVGVKLSVRAGHLRSPSSHILHRESSNISLRKTKAVATGAATSQRILLRTQRTHTSPDTIEAIATRILESRRITRSDQMSLLNITLSQVILEKHEKLLVDKVFDGLKLGILKVVD